MQGTRTDGDTSGEEPGIQTCCNAQKASPPMVDSLPVSAAHISGDSAAAASPSVPTASLNVVLAGQNVGTDISRDISRDIMSGL